jgi:TMEM175 potassium channel family protein
MFRTGRLEAFSDGVFAIAITLLVLEISVPPDAGDDLLDAFLDQWPSYLAYLVSFATIGVAWLRHTAITHHLQSVDTIFVRLNLLLLLLVSFLPFPTSLVAEHIHEDDAERVAATILGTNLLLVSGVIFAMWRYAVGHRLVRPDTGDDEIAMLSQRLTPGLAAYLIMILIGLALPIVAVAGYLVIAIALLLPIGLRHDSGLARHESRRSNLGGVGQGEHDNRSRDDDKAP